MAASQDQRFRAFLDCSRWISVLVALMYHLRFLLFVDYHGVLVKSHFSTAFYFLTGFGHEAFAVFFVVDGIAVGTALLARRQGGLARHTLVHRLKAFYGVLLPGLVLGAVADIIGVRWFNCSGLYTDYPDFSLLTLTLPSLLGNLVMLEPFIVPTFGSNAMLYLLSYLCWSFVLLMAYASTADLRPQLIWPARLLMVLAILLFMPHRFLIWMAIWLLGFGVAYHAVSGGRKPHRIAGVLLFCGTLILSRAIGADDTLLPHPLGAWLVFGKYFLVGSGFALLASALYQQPSMEPATGPAQEQRGRRISFVFFFHMPVMMLLTGMVSDALGLPLKQQPDLPVYLLFSIAVAASYGATALLARATTAPP